MVTIKNPVLKKQFEQFTQLGSEEEKKAFWENFSENLVSLSETEREDMRRSWLENMGNIDQRLKEIGKQLSGEISEISVFPENAEEARLIEALLSRMNVKYKVA